MSQYFQYPLAGSNQSNIVTNFLAHAVTQNRETLAYETIYFFLKSSFPASIHGLLAWALPDISSDINTLPDKILHALIEKTNPENPRNIEIKTMCLKLNEFAESNNYQEQVDKIIQAYCLITAAIFSQFSESLYLLNKAMQTNALVTNSCALSNVPLLRLAKTLPIKGGL